MKTMNLNLRHFDTEKGFLTMVSENVRKTFEIDGYALIGRDQQCTACILDSFTSLRHARIEKVGQGYVVRDLKSRNGTFVNGNRIIEAHLHDNDRLRIGISEFIFTFERDPSINHLYIESKNTAWNEQLSRLPAMAASPYPILILGPSGTGKEVLANLAHRFSNRSHGPFLSVNCSALTESLAESELFGHLKGSFTGATSDRKGAFEAARGGTLFLDEIGDLPINIQPKLLRALENNEIKPVGADRPTPIDVRIIAATNQNLKERVRDGKFREDLYFRLHVLQLTPPPLKDRMEDFDDLMKHFSGNQAMQLDVDAYAILQNYQWPGNIRELRNAIMRATALFGGRAIRAEDLYQLIDQPSTPTLASASASFITDAHEDTTIGAVVSVRQNIFELEKRMIVDRLRFFGGNQRRAAVALGIPKSTLHDRIKRYNIDARTIKWTARGRAAESVNCPSKE